MNPDKGSVGGLIIFLGLDLYYYSLTLALSRRERGPLLRDNGECTQPASRNNAGIMESRFRLMN